MNNYGHIFDHKSGLTECLFNDKGNCGLPVKKLNGFVHLVKKYGQEKIDTDNLAIRLVFCPD